MRLRLDLSYEGTQFHGWAAQPDLRTVQGEVEAALALVLRTDAVGLTCAGRTDSGVHARGQVTHFDIDPADVERMRGRSADDGPTTLVRRLNGVLPADIRVRSCLEAPAGFDARFSALWRRYTYLISDNPAAGDPLLRRHVLTWPRPLDVVAMNRGAEHLLGEHDFAAFCKPRAGATTIRTLLEISWRRTDADLVEGTVRADAFCHSMVRAITGALLAVGAGQRDPAWIQSVVNARVRDPGVLVAAARGLSLEEVAYPEPAELAAQAERARIVRTLPKPGPHRPDLGELQAR